MAILGIPFGWVLHWLQELIGNYGWTLIAFTVIVKILMTPLSIKQQKSSAKMAAFQPKLKELEKRYGKNKEKYQEEMMKLYEREGYSPTNGCLPMVVQMVILFGIIEVVYRPLRYVLQISKDVIDAACTALDLTSSQQLQLINIVQQGSGESFEKVKNIFSAADLAKIQEFDMNFLGLDLSQTPTLGFNWLILIPILAFATAMLVSLVSMKQQSSAATEGQQGMMMKVMMFASPVMSLFFTFQLPAGVGLYWIISNITSFASTEIVRRIYTPEKLAELAAKDKGSDRQREKMRKKREMLEALNQRTEGYREENDKNKQQMDKARKQVRGVSDQSASPSASQASNARKKDELSANDRIAAARKRMAELYGDEAGENETNSKDKK